jgi:N-acetylglucosamine transport system substrate-binding protein
MLEPGGSGYIWKNRPELNKKWTKEFNLWLLNLDIQNKFAQAGGVPTRRDFKFESEKKELSPSVVEAWKVINRKDLKVIDNRPRVRIVSNSEMAKIAKKREDGYIAVITGQKTGEQVAKEINSQYMKGLAADKRK